MLAEIRSCPKPSSTASFDGSSLREKIGIGRNSDGLMDGFSSELRDPFHVIRAPEGEAHKGDLTCLVHAEWPADWQATFLSSTTPQKTEA